MLILFCCSGLFVQAQNQSQWPREKQLWEVYNTASSDLERVSSLNELVVYYFDILGDLNAVDTLSAKSLQLARATDNESILINSLDHFFQYKIRGSTLDEANGLLDEVYALKNWEWHYRLFQAITYYKEHRFEAGAQAASFSLRLAKTADQQIRSLLWAGINSDKIGEKVKALNYFLDAQKLLETSSNQKLKIKVYSAIQLLYEFNGNHSRARFYCEKLMETVQESETIDTSALLQARYRYIMLFADSGFYQTELEEEVLNTLEYSKKNGYLQIYKDYWAFLRSHYISDLKIDRLYDLYVNIYPEQLERLRVNDLEKYYRMKAYLAEYKNNTDSAKYYWQLAYEYEKDTAEIYSKAHLTRRYAEFLFRVGDTEQAQEIALNALELSRASKFNPFIIDALELLIKIEEQQENYKQANTLLKQQDSLKIFMLEKSKASNLAVMSIKNEFKQLEQDRKNKEEKEQFRNRVYYVALITSLIVFIVVTYIVFRQYRQTRLEKDKSDKLLLNILPRQTAEELKSKGITTARRFNNVTVLFCDIVDFTKVAERLSPEDLVKEIDTYFRAFDDIIQAYGLEKIKTVGDAYVAVGGMPQHNHASARDVTVAALKIMEFIERKKREREAEGMPSFNLRIGINTGGVVAGVVGSIKFQYDIWGDAVNIAARMEQNSEPGRINISRNTYLEIRESFECTFRGKILAKNKGAIEMYFVDAH